MIDIHKPLKAVKFRHRKFKKYKDPSHPACKKANRQASKEIRLSRKNFERKLASKIKDDKKSLFSYARSKAKCKVQVESLVSQDGTVMNDACQIAKKFNDQFASVFTVKNLQQMPDPVQVFIGSNDDKLLDILVTESEILKRLANLKEDKSPGTDGMSSRFLKAISTVIAVSVTMIFNRSLSEGSVPADWEHPNISPVFKQGSRTLAENYRPISLMSFV